MKPTTLVGFFLFASDPCGKLASGGSDPCGRLASGGSDTSGELASGGSDPSGELASGGLCFELHFALQPRNSEYHLPRFILLPNRLVWIQKFLSPIVHVGLRIVSINTSGLVCGCGNLLVQTKAAWIKSQLRSWTRRNLAAHRSQLLF